MKQLFIVLYVMMQSIPVSAREAEGHEGGNGGHPFELEFVMAAEKVYPVINSMFKMGELDVSAEQFQIALDNALITTSDRVFVTLKNGELREKAALNFPQKYPQEIRISRAQWSLMSEDQKVILAVHEVLGLLEKEINTYEVSVRIQRFLDEQNQSVIEFLNSYRK